MSLRKMDAINMFLRPPEELLDGAQGAGPFEESFEGTFDVRINSFKLRWRPELEDKGVYYLSGER